MFRSLVRLDIGESKLLVSFKWLKQQFWHSKVMVEEAAAAVPHAVPFGTLMVTSTLILFDLQPKGTVGYSSSFHCAFGACRLATLDASKLLEMTGVGFNTRQSRFM